MTSQHGYGQELSAIKRENRELQAYYNALGPIACPNDGTVLLVRGTVRACPMGDFRWAE